MRDVGFVFIWIVLFPVALWSAHVGVLLWIWVALISPNEQLYGFMSGVPFNKVVAALTVLVLMFNKEKKQFYWDATVVCILLLAVVATGSEFSSIVPTDDGSNLYQKLLKELALVLLITGIMYSRYRIHMTVFVYCIALGFIGVVEGLEYAASGGGHVIQGTGAIGDNNSIALAILMMIPPLLYLIRYAELRAARLVLWAVLAICVICIVGTFSRGGFVGLIIMALFLLVNTKRKLPMIAMIALGAAAVLLLAPAKWFTRIDTIQDAGDNASFMGRVIAWKISTLIATHHPLFGGGFHAVQRYPVWFSYVNAMSSLSFIPTPPPDAFPHAAHSIYFEVLGDLGIPGIVLFLTILGVTLFNCLWIVRKTRMLPALHWAGDLARMLLVSIIVYMVSGALLSMAYYEGLWILVAIVSRVRHTVTLALAEAPVAVPTARPRTARERMPVAAAEGNIV